MLGKCEKCGGNTQMLSVSGIPNEFYCKDCHKSHLITREELEMLGVDPQQTKKTKLEAK